MPVELVFIHGWGFDAHFWDALGQQLPQFRQTHIDLGFFDAGSPSLAGGLRDAFMPGNKYMLVGHSFGFTHGLKERQDWSGWVAINSFPRFVKHGARPGCVTAAALRDMRMRLHADPAKTLQDFYRLTGATGFEGTLNAERLREGLDALRDGDVNDSLKALDVPGLVLAGRNDPLVPPATSEALGRFAKQGGWMHHDKGGHLLPRTDPGWCARAIADFVTTHFN